MDEGAIYHLVLRHHRDQQQEVRMSFFIAPRADGRFSQRLNIAAAVQADDSSFLHDLPASQQQVLTNEISAGLLMARRKAPGGWHVELRRLGAHHGQSRSLAETSSIAFAIGANLALMHASKQLDLIATPRGGYDWQLASFELAEPTGS